MDALHDVRDVELKIRPLRGGLDAVAVNRVEASYRDATGRARTYAFVVKRLEGAAVREARVYEQVVERIRSAPAPRLLEVDHPEPGKAVLFLEAVNQARAWPWRDHRTSLALLKLLAQFHLESHAVADAVSDWDYETELMRSAQQTLEALEQARSEVALSSMVRPGIWAIRHLLPSFPRLRADLLGAQPLHGTVLHGDVHPGNVLIRRDGGTERAVLIDWGRARFGSPLEDVSSWLQSLGFWEPEAKRRHDTLLGGYLSARGYTGTLSSELRARYWLAAASNGLAGALRYHLWAAQQARKRQAQRAAASAARDWVRVLRRAHASCC